MDNASPQVVSKQELRALAEDHGFPALSILFPTVVAAVETSENSLHLKNLVAEAEERLEASEITKAEVSQLLSPLHELLDDGDFWMHQSKGLAIFRGPEVLRILKLGFEVDETFRLGDRFYIKPLFEGLGEAGTFYILALSQGSIRLLRANKEAEAEEVDLSALGVPLNLDEALKWDDLPERAMPDDPGARPGSGISPMHGGTRGDQKDDQIRRFFQAFEPGISKLLLQAGAPLVLAGVEYLHPVYRAVSGYKHIVEKGVEGNPEGLRPDELAEKAWPLVQPVLRRPLMEAFDRYGVLQARGRASRDLEHALKAAHEGRVESLFILKGEEVMGRYDVTAGALRAGADDAHAVDLLDLAASQTLLQGGDVFLVDPPDMPSESVIAAVYRY